MQKLSTLLSRPSCSTPPMRMRIILITSFFFLREARDAFEKLYFEHHLRLDGGNMTRLAERSGLERTHLYRKLKQLDVKLGKRGEE